MDTRLTNPEYLIAKLTAKLSLAGVNVPPEANVEAIEVLATLPKKGVNVDVLGDVLASVYAHDEESYKKFWEVWNDILGRSKPEQLKVTSGQGLAGRAMEEVIKKVSPILGQKDFTPPSVDAIIEYGVSRWKRLR
ncbi:MAG: hypothetical protein GXO39_05380 [Thermotogae bacterium]|nr:hypothetical protein [Thermotogota bacterium]